MRDTSISFMRSLCAGEIEEGVLFPFPEFSDDEKEIQKVPGTALRIYEGGQNSANACQAPLKVSRRSLAFEPPISGTACNKES
jgi:hypothetical protein